MPHHATVFEEVLPEFDQVVAEGLAMGEVLLEAAEAAVQRVPSGVDDLCVRQHQVDQADAGEVIRHLVGEIRQAPAVASR